MEMLLKTGKLFGSKKHSFKGLCSYTASFPHFLMFQLSLGHIRLLLLHRFGLKKPSKHFLKALKATNARLNNTGQHTAGQAILASAYI